MSGILYKKSASPGTAPVGDDLVKMLDTMTHRGRDSSGITVVGEDIGGDLIIRIWSDESQSTADVINRTEESLLQAGSVIRSSNNWGAFLRFVINYEGEIPVLAETLLNTRGVALHSIGHVSEVIKDVGTPATMDSKHALRRLRGTHGIGHVRMATESRVDVNHAHPFWAYPFPDVTVVHNGQLTNYHKLKRAHEDLGHHFQTENDSELIAVYLADKLAHGETLGQALRNSLDDLDGTFTYLVSTREGLGYAKDQWSAKPLVTMENQDIIAIASEEIAFRGVFSEEIDRVEPQSREVMTWLL